MLTDVANVAAIGVKTKMSRYLENAVNFAILITLEQNALFAVYLSQR